MQPSEAAGPAAQAPGSRTEQADPHLPGVASPPPPVFTLVLWLGAFFTIAWGFRVLLLRLSGPDPTFARHDGPPPDAEDVTLEEPGPDRS